jgi:16S rRNA (guanine(966)-N(2))-methyltransferase RsmD
MSRIRVISGTAKGRRLQLVPGEGTRPIGDRVKEALFNILGPTVMDTAWLDLFAGTGSVGIEALSRGAGHAVFFDNDRRAVRTIEKNLQMTGLGENADVVLIDSLQVLIRPSRYDQFDFVFVAPPQYKDLWSRSLHLLDATERWLNPEAQVIVQLDPKEYNELELAKLKLFDRRSYGSTELLFYENKDDETGMA